MLKVYTHMSAVGRRIDAVIMYLGADVHWQALADFVRKHSCFDFLNGLRDWANG